MSSAVYADVMFAVQSEDPLPLSEQVLNYALARTALQYAPKAVAGRESHVTRVREFWQRGVRDARAGLLYASGRPGCGKTATISAATADFERWLANDDDTGRRKVAGRSKVFVNCAALTRTAARQRETLLGSIVARQAAIGKSSAVVSDEQLTRAVTTRTVLLILDEVDQLDVELLYRLIELTLIPASRLLLIGIANSLDLIERCLPRLQKSAAREQLRLVRIAFDAYSADAIAEIIRARLGDARRSYRLVSDSAVTLCARKAATVGDARNALEFLTSALSELRDDSVWRDELARQRVALSQKWWIDVREMNRAISSVSGARNKTAHLYRTDLSLHHRLLLLAVAIDGIESDYGKTLAKYQKLCKRYKHAAQERAEAFASIDRLADLGLVAIEKAHSGAAKRRKSMLPVSNWKVSITADKDNLKQQFARDPVLAPIAENELP